MQLIKQSEATAARRRIPLYMVGATDGFTPETGLSITATVSKNGAAFGAGGGSVTEIGNGAYYYEAATGDVDTLGTVLLRAAAAGARDFLVAVEIVAFDPFDAVRAGLTALPNANAGANGGLPTGNASGQVAVASLANNAITAAAINDGAITAAKIATGAIDADAIAADAVTELQSGLATQASVDTIAGYLDTEVAAIKAQTDLIPAAPAAVGDIPTANQVSDAVAALVIEGTITLLQAQRVMLAVAAGASDGVDAAGTATFKSMDGSKTRVSTTINSTGERTTNPTLDVS